MNRPLAIVFTDIADSTALQQRLGDVAMAKHWQLHDQAARKLIQRWHGQEVGRSDGFLVVFDAAEDAVGFAVSYRDSLADGPLAARVGVHVGHLTIRRNASADIERGANPIELDGIALPVAARVMQAAAAGQVVLTEAVRGTNTLPVETRSIGHWQLKGLDEPTELFECWTPHSPLRSAVESAKAYRVVRDGERWRPATAVANNLPALLDGFVGRDSALKRVTDTFDSGARLVTLLGAGGGGKTRTALQFASRTLGEHAIGGVWFCDLSAAKSLDGLLYAVAQALGVALDDREPAERLGHAIAGRVGCLIVLDNVEQVVGHAAAVFERWLARAPWAHFLVTSREVLGLVGERIIPLEPMTETEGLTLFEMRAAEAGCRIDLAHQPERDALIALVRLLDGLPLALELAAARCRSMPIATMVVRMDERFRLLSSRRGRAPRHLTMRAALEWSWDLLQPDERLVLTQLRVFASTFDEASVQSVVEVAPGDIPWKAIELLHALVDKSMVTCPMPGRFRLLKTVRDYVKERGGWMEADGGLHARVLERHWKYFARASYDAGIRRERLEDLVVACSQAAAAKDFAASVDCLYWAWLVISTTGPFRALLELIAVAKQADDGNGGRARVILHWIEGRVHLLLGDLTLARSAIDSALGLHLTGLDAAWSINLLCASAEQRTACGHLGSARAELDLALRQAETQGLIDLRKQIHNARGSLAHRAGDPTEAHAEYKRALLLCRQTGDADFEGGLLGNLAEVSMSTGDTEQALTWLREGLDSVARSGHRRWEGNMRCNLGLLFQGLGQLEQARAELEKALRIAREIGSALLEATTACNIGIVDLALGNNDRAIEAHRTAVALAHEIGDRRAEGQFSIYLAQAYARADDKHAALALLKQSKQLLQEVDDPPSLALALCEEVMLLARSSQVDHARQALKDADDIARRHGLSAASEVGRALRAAAQALADAHPTSWYL